jgi:predicted dehydrogenase
MTSERLRLALIGLGFIGRRRHIPIIAGHPRFELVAAARPRGGFAIDDVRLYADYHDLLEQEGEIDAVSICTQPRIRYDIAMAAIRAGRHVLMEKPPTTTLGELDALSAAGAERGVTLMVGWHSQFNVAVERAAALLAGKQVASLELVWEEDPGFWHPNQSWIWEPGGFGVFDAGVNALSILCKIWPGPLIVEAATLTVAAGAATPVAAEIAFRPTIPGGALHATMDWRAKADRRFISIETTDGLRIGLTESGRHLSVDGARVVEEDNHEYERIYDRFAELIEGRQSAVDQRPLRLVSDICLIAKRQLA